MKKINHITFNIKCIVSGAASPAITRQVCNVQALHHRCLRFSARGYVSQQRFATSVQALLSADGAVMRQITTAECNCQQFTIHLHQPVQHLQTHCCTAMNTSMMQRHKCTLEGSAARSSWPMCSRSLMARRRSPHNLAARSSSSSSVRHGTVAAAAQPTAVITGCSTGIGRDTAVMLAENVRLSARPCQSCAFQVMC